MVLLQVARIITTLPLSLSFPFSTFVRTTSGLRSIRSGICLNISGRVASMSSSTSKEMKQIDKILSGKEDYFGGVVVEMSNEPLEIDIFAASLRASLAHWMQQGKRGVWIKLPIELVNLVETAVKEGFYYHHAEPNYLMLVHWIPATNNTLPANASHRVGIGAFVMNEKNEVLVVQENSGRFQGTGVWKFPTGVVDQGEDICDAAVREVKEETGIDAKFIEILAFRQTHMSFFGKSDLFFVCMLQPLSSNIQIQEAELEAAQKKKEENLSLQGKRKFISPVAPFTLFLVKDLHLSCGCHLRSMLLNHLFKATTFLSASPMYVQLS
ncbi:hypothetical protein Leryth_022531 [Lithospermum erythrorhizon]|nr:hypothetical protein Leryth_022531 [Lithospermum erythrorhizon]